jgi:hypothetical protein
MNIATIANRAKIVGLLDNMSASETECSEICIPAEFTMTTPSMSNEIETTMMPWPARI